MSDRPMQGALIGFGTIAQSHAAVYARMDDVSIGAVVDVEPARRRRAAQIMPGVRTYASMARLFASERLDFIDICSPPNSHARHVRAGLMHGCHVLCEKPLLLSADQNKDILELAHDTRRLVYPCHNYKFSPAARMLQQCARSGQLGRLVEGRMRVGRTRHAAGVSDWRPDWRRNARIARGGILCDHGTHAMYLTTFLCGQPPSALSCRVARLDRNSRFDTEDTAFLILDFGDIRWTINLTWTADSRSTYFALIGDRQSVIIDNNEVRYLTPEGTRTERMESDFDDPGHTSWFNDLFGDFRETVAQPERHASALDEALITTRILETAYASARRGGAWLPVPSAPKQLKV